MGFALETQYWDTMTIVDSDQLSLRPGFSALLARHLAGRRGIGMLCGTPEPQPRDTQVPPAATALREIDLWRPLLRRFPNGESKYVHWNFWPGTVFTADAARDLTRMFAEDGQLREILAQSHIWATEEVILPTLVALLGHEIARGPASYDFVAYRGPYEPHEIEAAFSRSDVFWAHPVPREYRDPLRARMRGRFAEYRRPREADAPKPADAAESAHELRIVPILVRMQCVSGWLEEDEAEFLIASARDALTACPSAPAIVEVGSHLGRGTVVLASVAQALGSPARVHAIDPHEGYVGALDTELVPAPSSPAQLRANLEQAGVAGCVQVDHASAAELAWSEPIALLLIDGLHDYASTARDFFCFEPFVPAGGFAAFHDYAEYFPGVVAFVDELLESGAWRRTGPVRSMIVLQRAAPEEARA
jgi:hypothetical protein